MDPIDRMALNDMLTSYLSSLGWTSQDDDDDDRLNELTHQVGDLLDEFLAGKD